MVSLFISASIAIIDHLPAPWQEAQFLYAIARVRLNAQKLER
ncbi:hypothetical protein C789_269 [Microcystis aeruginosa FACHB-905 = DIANCHI905]|uniref:Uncharacterized protein n=1 Tax=Microcystis aeruginosa PCC 7806SL TaxID=1903187 RepID=A0AB33BZH1_MICA7|nr:hypothetical protein BH695_3850 [Microcystis aeruginosa PCC 7806SL]ELS49918.1 hypothetical protein C789_269 [Microcystis aeruginosa FACHB-905 = DIANCHI905]